MARRTSLAEQVGVNVAIEHKPDKGSPEQEWLLTITDDSGAVLRSSRHLNELAAKTAVSHWVRKQYPDHVAQVTPRPPSRKGKRVKLTRSEQLFDEAAQEEATAKALRLEADRCERRAAALRQAATILDEADA